MFSLINIYEFILFYSRELLYYSTRRQPQERPQERHAYEAI